METQWNDRVSPTKNKTQMEENTRDWQKHTQNWSKILTKKWARRCWRDANLYVMNYVNKFVKTLVGEFWSERIFKRTWQLVDLVNAIINIIHQSGHNIIFHQPRFPWNNWISLPKSYSTFWGEGTVWGRYHLTKSVHISISKVVFFSSASPLNSSSLFAACSSPGTLKMICQGRDSWNQHGRHDKGSTKTDVVYVVYQKMQNT